LEERYESVTNLEQAMIHSSRRYSVENSAVALGSFLGKRLCGVKLIVVDHHLLG